MFQSLRPNSQIYVLHKNNNPKLEVGYVSSVSIPKPKYSMPQAFGQQEMVVDITAKVGEYTVNYNNLPATSDIADTYSNSENVVISMSKDAMNSEINNLKQKSEDIVNSIDIHKAMIDSYNDIIMSLNPDFAEKQKQKDEINMLKEQMSTINKNMEELMRTNKLMAEKIMKGI